MLTTTTAQTTNTDRNQSLLREAGERAAIATGTGRISTLELNGQLDRTGQIRFIDCAQISTLVKRALREAFPGCKFSVTSSRTGGSVYVRWTDGPSTMLVESITSRFEGQGFDGMTDSTVTRKMTLDGQPARFCSFISTDRSTTVMFDRRAGRISAATGQPLALVRRKLSDRMAARPSATAERVRFVAETPLQPAQTTYTVEVTDRHGQGYEAEVVALSAVAARAAGNAEATAAGFPPADPLATRVSAEGRQLLPLHVLRPVTGLTLAPGYGRA